MRIFPIGYDCKYNNYYHFRDVRLYKEAPVVKKKKSVQSKKRKRELSSTSEATFGKWTLVCQTAEDWHEFSQRLVDSRNPNEKDFGTFLQKELIPEILTIFQLKEKVLKKRLLSEVIPCRVSARVAKLRQIQEDENEKQKQQAELLSKTNRQRDIIARKTLPSAPKSRSQRLYVQQLDSFSSDSPAQTNTLSSTAAQDSPPSSNHGSTPLHEMEKQFCAQLLDAVKNHPKAWPFMEPVDPITVPDYYEIIKAPMDLISLSENIDKFRPDQSYTLNHFLQDLQKIFHNCKTYNSPETVYFKCAVSLEKFAQKTTENLLSKYNFQSCADSSHQSSSPSPSSSRQDSESELDIESNQSSFIPSSSPSLHQVSHQHPSLNIPPHQVSLHSNQLKTSPPSSSPSSPADLSHFPTKNPSFSSHQTLPPQNLTPFSPSKLNTFASPSKVDIPPSIVVSS
eukprot:Sdes_comp16286_c0_seq2m5634